MPVTEDYDVFKYRAKHGIWENYTSEIKSNLSIPDALRRVLYEENIQSIIECKEKREKIYKRVQELSKIHWHELKSPKQGKIMNRTILLEFTHYYKYYKFNLKTL